MPPPQLFVTITSPTGGLPTVNRTFQLAGNISWMFTPSNWSLTSRSVSVQFGPGGPTVGGTFVGNNWTCTGTVSPSTPWGSMVQLTVSARATFRFFHTPSEPDLETLTVTTTFMVRLFPAIAPTVALNPFASPIIAAQLPAPFVFTGSATSPQAPIQVVQYKVENGQFANAVKVSDNWSQWRITLPLPPNDHTLTIRAIDTFGTVGEISKPFTVQPQPPIVIPPGAKTTFSGAPTTSSITSWTRLEPQCTDADMGTSSGVRVFDPLWLLTRQWQMGEFQAEDAGTPIQARVRATTATLTRRYSGELPKSPTGGPTAIAAPAYDPLRTPLEVLVERRRMRAADANDARMLTFAVEAGLHFLRMLELQSLSKSYRSAFLTKLALAPASSALVDDATSRYMQSMVGRAPDGRQLAAILRTGAAQLVLDTTLNIATADRPKVQQAATAWLAWYDSMYSEPESPTDDAWDPPRLEYALSVGTRLSANAQDDMTFSATEIDGPIDWSSFDVNTQASLTTTADQSFTSIVEATIPAPVNFPGAPAPRFWEMEDARIAYGLVPVGPTDLAQLLMIEYASSFGNDWFVVPLTLPVGSVTRVESLVVMDTFGVRNLVRPIGDPAIPPAHFSLWQSAYKNPPAFSPASRIATNRFFLPPTLSRTMDSAPLEDVLFMRDEMANLAWAIERTVESPIEQAAQRYEAPDAVPSDGSGGLTSTNLPRYLLSSQVPPNWIPLLPVQVPTNTSGQILSRLKRGAVLQPDGTKKVHGAAMGEVLLSVANLLLYDEEVPREGARITRQRRLARWTDGSTWLWTSFRNQVGKGEGASALKFDQLLEPLGTRPALTDFTLAPPSLIAGATAEGALTLSGPAPAGGLKVTLTRTVSTPDPVAEMPAEVLVPVGQAFASFTLKTKPNVAGSVSVEAKLDPVSLSDSLQITVVAVSISPPSASLVTNSSQQFIATVTGSDNKAVTWSVQGVGSVTAAGLYSAPSAPGSSQVIAQSVADPSKSATATVTVAPKPKETKETKDVKEKEKEEKESKDKEKEDNDKLPRKELAGKEKDRDDFIGPLHARPPAGTAGRRRAFIRPEERPELTPPPPKGRSRNGRAH